MTLTDTGRPDRVLAEAIGNLPGGLAAVPATPDDLAEVVAVVRAAEIVGFGRSETNAVDVSDELSAPTCRWGKGAVLVRRDQAAVAVLLSSDGLAEGRGWDFDLFLSPAEPQAMAVAGPLIDGALVEGQARWERISALPGSRGLEPPTSRSFCFATDERLRAALEERGFREARRYWRMRLDQAGPASRPGETGGRRGSPAGLPPGYSIEVATNDEVTRREIHAVSNAAFADHFDSTPLDFQGWSAVMTGPTHDASQWLVVRQGDRIVGFALGSNRFASEGAGYLASLAVLAEHRGRGLASTLLRARFADDRSRGFSASLLHCDAQNTTGATRVYQGVGMHVDQEYVALHRPLLDG